MYFIIEYVDSYTGAGEAVAWEFAKTNDEAIIKARAHLIPFKARFAAQGYRIVSPAGSVVERGPAAAAPKVGAVVADELLFTHGRRSVSTHNH